ncbi:DHH family phosphoesterase [Romboutsia lituseburensis]|uniref:Phosphoesterase RecJ domain-containing protein n=1 Tax=Romboutsia lituseburensis DSM 797 TaxID=1121325 RepID=A0A1G9LCY3_9FIRM|nr:bifunctional oligoribonuclease/PAP phosphatase NrnA [Romboutsia lituseburensis]CEH35264.1 Bifunctional oligoribonuclease and PAP phosphatase NrnA [Romboutsia lituseburensis]SDL59811.1 phosphoesterase RecJ domain-containing protein [Romboutsia lituseburensis DSM 797]
MKNNIDNIIEFLHGSNDFVVTSHVSPDGDNIGSTLGMYYSLKKLGKNVYYVLDDSAPLNLNFLVDGVKILKSSEFEQKDYSIIALDCGDKSRICLSDDIRDSAKTIICIDHHASNDAYGDLNYIDANASSTCELVYNLLVEFKNIKGLDLIDENIATALYTGLVTDTGNFAYSSTHPSSFEMAKELLLKGAKRDMIIQQVFQSNPYNYYKLLGEALNTLDIIDGKVASISITKEMLKNNTISFNDVDGITSYTRDIQGVEVGILLKEKKENEVKVSLRSKNYVDVSQIAQSFNGGGHVRAAGCTIYDSVENAKKKVLEAVLKTI